MLNAGFFTSAKMLCVLKDEKKLEAACSQPVSARLGARRGRRRGQGDGGGQVRRVVHGQDQAGAPDGHLLLGRGQVLVQPLVPPAAPGAGRGGALPVDGAGAGGVGADGDVGVHGAHAGVVQDEVGVVVVQLTFILKGAKASEGLMANELV